MKQDLAHAIRSLSRTPVVVTVIVLSLAVGIGVNTVVFSWIQALVFRPMPGVADVSRFHVIEPVTDTGVRPGASWMEYRDLAERLRAFDEVIAFRMTPLNIGDAPNKERTAALLVSGNYFRVLALQPHIGRFVQPDEAETAGRAPVAVVSYDYWQRRLGGAPDAIGRTLRVNDVDVAVIGITPENFQGTVLGLQFDLWVPATMAPVLLGGSRELEDRRMRGYYVMGALAATASLEQAQAAATAAAVQIAREFPETSRGMTMRVLPFWRASRGPTGFLLQGLAVLQGVMLLLLLAICGNTANLVLARAAERRREFGIRLAVGAGSGRLLRLLLVEHLLLGLSAAALGALIAWWGSNALRAMPLLTLQFPVRFQTGLNSGTLLFAITLGAGCALVFGMAPAMHLLRAAPQSVLRSGASFNVRRGLPSVLMAVQVALAMVVLLAAGLFYRSFQNSRDTDPGFVAEGVLLASYDLTAPVSEERARNFAARLLDELRGTPEITAAAIASSVPLDIHGLPNRSFELEGRRRTDGMPDRSRSNVVSDGYFEVMQVAFVSGEDFALMRDAVASPQAIVNQTFVARYLDGREPLGRRLTSGSKTYTVVGVVRDSISDAFGEPPTPVIYFSLRDRPAGFGEIHVRSRPGDVTLAGSAVRSAVQVVDSALPVFNVRTLTDHVEMNLALRRIPARMFAVLGPLILVLAGIGIYAVVSHNVAHRTPEMGVRMALGASTTQVLHQVLTESLAVASIGAALGWAAITYIYMRFMGGDLDIAIFGGVPLLLLTVAVAASWIPARRASRVEPVVALRAE